MEEKDCNKLLGGHCWISINAIMTDNSGNLIHPPKFKRMCKHCKKTEYKTMEEMLKDERRQAQ